MGDIRQVPAGRRVRLPRTPSSTATTAGLRRAGTLLSSPPYPRPAGRTVLRGRGPGAGPGLAADSCPAELRRRLPRGASMRTAPPRNRSRPAPVASSTNRRRIPAWCICDRARAARARCTLTRAASGCFRRGCPASQQRALPAGLCVEKITARARRRRRRGCPLRRRAVYPPTCRKSRRHPRGPACSCSSRRFRGRPGSSLR